MTKKLSSIILFCFFLAGLAFPLGRKDRRQSKKAERAPLPPIETEDFNPEKVVALSRSVAEMWLLAGGRLAGATSDALDLDGLQDGAASIGTLTAPSMEAVMALEPDLVLLTGDIPAHKRLRPALEEAGIRCYAVDVKDFNDYAWVMFSFAALTGRKDLFERNVLDVGAEIAQVKSAVPEDFSGTFVLLRVSAARNKVLKDHFAVEIISAMHLSSIADDAAPLDDLSLEAILQADPTYIFVVAQGDEERGMQIFAQMFTEKPAWQQLSAVQNGRVVLLPKDLFNYKPNARWAEAYRYMYDVVFAPEPPLRGIRLK